MPGKYPARRGEADDECTPLKPQTTATSSLAGGVPSKKPELAEPEEEISLTKHPIEWAQSLSRTYSWRLLAMVVCTNHLLKGFVAGGGDGGLVGQPIEFIFGDLGITASRLQMLKAAAISPWALKPAIALLSDACPINGYKKMPYVVITTVLSFGSTIALGLGVGTVPVVVACLWFIFLQISSVDLLVEAKQSEEVKKMTKLGPQFFTFTWLGINMGQLAAVCLVGFLIVNFGARFSYLVAAPFILLVLWPTLCNFLGERQLPMEDRGLNLHMIHKHPVLVSLTGMIALLIVFLIFGTFALGERHIIVLALGFAMMVLTSFAVFIRREIAGPVIFYFLLGMLSFNVDGALFYFYTDTAAEYPDGPHLSTYFYTTGLGIVTFVGIMFGFVSGSEIFKGWSYRDILKVTIVLRAGTQLLLVPVLTRWTSRMGIPDTVWLLTMTMMDTMVFAWRWIPKQIMGAHLTPHGVEATMLGLTAGTFNMAMILSSYCGGFLLSHYGVHPNGDAGDSQHFEHLWKAQVAAALAPCSMLVLLPVLIPAKLQTEALLVERPDSATYNSVYEVLTQQSQRRLQQEQQP
eukprot:gnl/TRDRNA2_/TRDRNA2_130145_c0_seq1.p1 gnl/TRDRNA2_/TRDRNA2_130145_c0~~gnl/TRDRNA2_/TRDRNA2_130145_c0_seq1.p1  ORF type:complete len:576 (+),score=118.52 gnl/TRDRNA2_/TRDRNA2_130145_c0_seq1:86-1813(+)